MYHRTVSKKMSKTILFQELTLNTPHKYSLKFVAQYVQIAMLIKTLSNKKVPII